MRSIVILLLLFCLPLQARPRVALVLGGGGARGIAHVGVLEELEKADIPIDLIVGCSAGGIVGALYADCKDAVRMETQFSGLKRRTLIEVNLLQGRFGLSGGRALRRFLRKNVQATDLKDLQIPLIVVATDLHTGELIEFSEGPLCPAVTASAAYPFVFQPVKYEGRTLVDGGILEPVPVSVARRHHPDLIIAVDVGMPLAPQPPTHLFGVLQRSIEITYAKQSLQCVEDADIVISPDLGDMGVFEDGRNEFACKRGREAAREVLPQILEALGRVP